MFGKLVLHSEIGLLARTVPFYTVFFDGVEQGTFVVGGTAELRVEKDCDLTIRIDDYDLVSNTIRIYCNSITEVDIYFSKYDRECEITVLSATLKDDKRNAGGAEQSSKSNTQTQNQNQNQNQNRRQNQNHQQYQAYEYDEQPQKEPSTFKKLSVVGGWVHTFVGFLLGLTLVCGFIVTLMALFDGEFEIALIVLGSALLGALFIYVDYIIAGRFFFAAIDKGYNDTYYLALSFFIPPYGHRMIIALPDRGNGKKNI